ncbi:MAG: aldo/keto reductase, partial [Eggerthellaceae bacterium]|nr:aldo/keto reductase [Eggerthellaceae bacterium]
MKELEPNVSKLGFGLMRLPKLEDGKIDIEQVKTMVDDFIAAGGTYFDTARAYGDSEAAIGQALVARYPRESFYLATKNAAWIGPKTAEQARADFDISLEQTGAGYFDFYLIHKTGATRTKVFDDLDMWSFVRELKDAGKVRHIDRKSV